MSAEKLSLLELRYTECDVFSYIVRPTGMAAAAIRHERRDVGRLENAGFEGHGGLRTVVRRKEEGKIRVSYRNINSELFL